MGGKNVTTNISERTTHLRVFLLVQLLMNPAFGASSIIFKMKVGSQKDDYVNELWTNVVETSRQGFQLGSKNSLDGNNFLKFKMHQARK